MNKKKNTAAKLVSKFFQENPEAMELLDIQPDGSLFSPEMKEALSPFKDMDVRECVKSVDFMKALCKHAGMSDEQFNEILNNVN